MASNKVAEYAKKMREKKLAEVGKAKGAPRRRNRCAYCVSFIAYLTE